MTFHAENPQVYEILRRESLYLAIDKNWNRGSIKFLWERLRWIIHVETNVPLGDFKLGNDYHSRYARLLMEQEPELVGWFVTRELRAA